MEETLHRHKLAMMLGASLARTQLLVAIPTNIPGNSG